MKPGMSSIYLVASVLLVAGIAGALFTSQSSEVSAADWRLVDNHGTPISTSNFLLIGTIPVSGGTVTLDPGYIYQVEIAGGSGGGAPFTGGSGGTALGGRGTMLKTWVNLVWENDPITFNYVVGGIGADRPASGNAGGTGGSGNGAGGAGGGGVASSPGAGGGGASSFSQGSTILIVAGGGGGAGGMANNGTSGGAGGSAGVPTATPTSGIYNGTAGTTTNGGGGGGGTASGGTAGTSTVAAGAAGGAAGSGIGGAGGTNTSAGGGGGGGGGYTGGGGGGSSAGQGNASGGGGGGGSSYNSALLTPLSGAAYTGAGYITIYQYVIKEDAQIVAGNQTVVYNGSPQTIIEDTTTIVGAITGMGPTNNADYLLYQYRLAGSGNPWTTTPPTNAGTYDVQISFLTTQQRYSLPSSTSPPIVTLQITPAPLDKPVPISTRLAASGSTVTLPLVGFDPTTMGITGNTGVVEDNYTATISLLNPSNFMWADSTNTPFTIQWMIHEGRQVSGVVTFYNTSNPSDPLNGTPLAGVLVLYSTIDGGTSAVTNWPGVTTDSSGRFDIFFIGGDTMNVTGASLYGYMVDPPNQMPLGPFTYNILVPAPSTSFKMSYNPLHPFTVTGTIVLWDEVYGNDEINGTPLQGVVVEYDIIINGVPSRWTTFTDANGFYTISAPAGSMVEIVSISANGYIEQHGHLWGPSLMNQHHTDVDFQMRYAAPFHKLQGVVKDTSGNPIAGVSVEFSVRLDTNPDADGMPISPGMVIRTGSRVTDVNGYYEVIVEAAEGFYMDVDYWTWLEITDVTRDGYLLNDVLAPPPPYVPPRFHELTNDVDDPIIQDFTMRATFRVTFDPANGDSTWFVDVDLTVSSLVAKPADPVRPGWTFTGWYAPSSSVAWNFSTDHVVSDTTLTAGWNRILNVWIVTVNATNLNYHFISPSSAAVTDTNSLTMEFIPPMGFDFPSTIVVTMGGSTLTAGTDYTWSINTSTNIATLVVNSVTADVVITASGVSNGRIVTFGVFNLIGGSISAAVNSTPISNGDLVTIGSDVVFTATPTSSLWEVRAWRLNGTVTGGTGNTYTLTNLSADANVTVEFQLIPYTVTFSVVGDTTGGTLTGETLGAGGVNLVSPATVNAGSNLLFTAFPSSVTHWRIKEWTVNGVTLTNARSLPYTGAQYAISNLSSNLTVTVEFERIPLVVSGTVYDIGTDLTVSGATVNYTINGTPQTGVTSNSSGAFTLNAFMGDTIVITGASAPGSYVYVTTTPSNTFTTSSSASVYIGVPFQVDGVVYDLGAEDVKGGINVSWEINGVPQTDAVSDSSGDFTLRAYKGQTIVITGAAAGQGYVYIRTDPSNTFTGPGGAVVFITVLYEVTITVEKDGTIWTDSSLAISLRFSGTTVNLIDNLDGTFSEMVLPRTYNIFVGGVDTGRTVVVNGSGANAATLDYWTLTVTAGTGITSVTGSGTILSGMTANISATPPPLYHFDEWVPTPSTWTPVPVTAAATITMPSYALTLTAYGSEDPYLATINVEKDGLTWSNSSLAISLRFSGTTVNLTDNLDGTFTAMVLPRTYNIFVGGVDTGRTLTITSSGANSATLDYWTLTVSAGTGITSVTGSGVILAGMTANISATPESTPNPFRFDRWEPNPTTWTPVPSTAAATITMPSYALTLTAYGSENAYTATITVEKDGTIWTDSSLAITLRYSGTTVTMTDNLDGTFTYDVLPRTYNIFVGGVDTGRTLTVTSIGTNSAILDYWSLTVTAGSGIASVTGSGVILSGMTANISATAISTPNPYHFDKWLADPTTWTPVPTTRTATITMPSYALTLTAYGTEDEFLATITVEKDGTTWSNSLLAITLRYSGTTVTMTDNSDGTFTHDVLPRTYNIFVGGVDTGRTLTVTSIGTNSAILDYWSLTVTAGTGVDSVTGSGTILSGMTANISATPTILYTFDKWLADPATWTPVPTTKTATITMPAYALALTAYATEDTFLATVTVEKDGTTWSNSSLAISLRYSGTTINLTDNLDGTFTYSVLPRTYNIFVGGVDTGRVLTVTSIGTNSAILDYWSLTVTAGAGVDSVTGSGTILSGMTANISATPTALFTFDKWEADPATWTPVPTTKTATITMPSYALTLTAYATEDPYLATITVEKDGTTWSNSSLAISLRYSGTTINLTDNLDGTFTATVLPRTYNIFVGGVDTGRVLTVTSIGTNSAVLDYWTLTVTAGTGIASVTGSGTILSGMTANISATPTALYTFDKWEADPATWTPVPSLSAATITMPSYALTLTAYATEDAFLATITVEKDGTTWSNSSLAISLRYNSTTINLTDNLDGTFTYSVVPRTYNIFVGGVDTGRTLTVTSIGTNSAILDYWTLTVTAGTGIASVTGSGTILSGMTANISATPTTGFTFDKWEADPATWTPVPSISAATITMPAYALTLTAYATEDEFLATITVEKDGTTWSNSSLAISLRYSGTTINLTDNLDGTFTYSVVPRTYNIFVGGVDTGRTLTVTSIGTNSAILDYWTLTVTAGAGVDSVTGSGTILSGMSANISATPTALYTFDRWEADPATWTPVPSTSAAMITMPSYALTLTAYATEDPYLATITVEKDGTTWTNSSLAISLRYSGTTINLTDNLDGTFTYSVLPRTYNIFVGGVDTGRVLTVTSIGTNSAILDYWTLTVTAGTGVDSVTGSGTILSGMTANISATPTTGFTFDKWIADPATWTPVPTAAAAAITMPSYALELTAYATEDAFLATITVEKDGTTWTTSGLAITLRYSGITVTLTDNHDGTFDNGVVPRTYSIYVGGVDTGRTLTVTSTGANSAILDYWTLTVTAGTGIASASGSGTILSGMTANVSASPTTGFTFDKWIADPATWTPVPTTAAATITMPAYALSLTAYATEDEFLATVTVEKDGTTWTTSGLAITLRYSGTTVTMTDNSDGTFTYSVVPRTYSIFVGGVDTGRSLTVTSIGTNSAILDYWTLTVTAGAGVDSVTGSGTILSGMSANISATPTALYTFDRWEADPATWTPVPTTAAAMITMPSYALTLTAYATEDPYLATITVEKDGTTWTTSGLLISLRYSGTTVNLTDNTDGTFTATVLPRTYNIFVGGVDTGRVLTVTSTGTNSTVLDYWTLTVTVGAGVDSVTGSGTVLSGMTANISATPTAGFTFDKWVANPATWTPVPTTAVATITMPSYALELTASATEDTFRAYVYVQKDGSTWTNSSFAISLRYSGTTINLNDITDGSFNEMALPRTYNIFVGGVDTGRTLTVTSTGTNSAILDYWTLTVTAGTGISSVAGSGIILSGSSVNISATPTTGFTFDKWIADPATWTPVPTTTAALIRMPAYALSLTANATEDEFLATITVEKDGSTWSNSLLAISLRYSGSTVYLTDNSDGTFTHDVVPRTYNIYVDGVDTGRTLAVTSTGTNSAILDYWTLTVTAGTGVDSVTGSGVILSGMSADISATPTILYTFDRWEADPATWTPVPTTAAAMITMPAYALELTAYATEDEFLATITVENDGATWSTSGLAITLRYSGTTVYLTDNLDGTFTHDVVPRTYNIYVDGVDTGRTLTVTSTGTNSAILDYWTLTVTAGTGVDSVTGSGTILSGMTANISATPTAGFTFDRWEANPATWTPVPTNAADTITMPAYALELTAYATEDPFPVTITVEKDGTTWDTSGLIITLRYNGSSISLTDNLDGTFTNTVLPKTYKIYVGGVDTGRTLTVTSTGTNSAILDYWGLNVSEGTGVASVTGGGVILSGMTTSISATPTAGFTFDRWEANPATWTPVPTTATATITMPANALTLTAYATEDPFLATITVERDGATWTNSLLAITLRYSGTTITMTDNLDGTFTYSVLPRTYNIYVGGVDTGRTITITSTGINSEVLDYWTLTVTAGTGVASVTGSGVILSGMTADISATPTALHTFDRWEADPATWTPVPTTAAATITMPAKVLTLTAYATEDTFMATVFVEKDGIKWGASGLAITLRYSGSTISLTDNFDGSFTCYVLPRTYDIYANGVDTGRTLTVTSTGIDSTLLDYWTLTVTAGTGIASVTGSGVILSGMPADISATPTAGFTFDEWVANPATWTPVPTTAAATITMPSYALTLTAYATEDTYLATITVERDGTTWTNSSLAITLRYSGTTITMTDNLDGTFTYDVLPRTYNIYVGGMDTGRTLTVNGSGTNSAVLDYWTLTVSAGTGVASVTGSGTILSGMSASISATPTAGFTFDRWEANPATWTPVPTTAAATITMPANALTLTAYATEDTYLATITVERDGTTWTTSGLVITLRYSGTTITLTDNLDGTFTYNVVPRTYNIYVGGVDTGRTLLINGSGTNSAVLDYWTLTVTAGTGVASVTGSGTILSGMSANISATPTAGFTFDRWEANPATWTPVPTTATATITMPAKALELTAYATEDPFIATITVERDGTTWSTSGLAITLRYSGTTITMTDNLDGTFTYSVLPRTYNIYVGGVDTGRTLTVTSTGANSAILDYWTLTVTAGTGIASVTGSGTILSGMTADISATPTALFTFDRWEADPATWTPVPTTAAATITMPAKALTLTAYATEDTFLATITVERDGTTWTMSGLAITLRYSGTTVTMTDNLDGTFTYSVLPRTYNIYVGGVDTGRTLTVTSTGANSAILDYWTLTVTAGTGVASVTGSGTILSGMSASISATPNAGFSFDRWEANPATWTPVPTTAAATITMPANALTLTAYATEDTYLVTITVERDGTTWTTSGLAITLRYSGTTITLTDNHDGTFTYNVVPRTYNIYVGGVDTGRTLLINGSGTNSAVLDYWTLTVTAGTGIASVTGSGTILSGMSANISATPTALFTFDRWEADPATWTPVPTTATATITMPAYALTLTAYATEDPFLATITVERDGTTWTTSGLAITLRYSGTTITMTDNLDGTFTYSVLPRTYNIYVGGVDTGRTLTVTSTGTNSAILDYWTLTVTAGTGIASVTGSGTILSGMTADISATPTALFTFDRWEANPATWTPVPTTAAATITMPANVLELTAYATEDTFLATITVERDGTTWTMSGLAITLRYSGTTITMTDNLDGTFTYSVLPRTYNIYVGGVDTGRTLTVTSTGTNSAVLDYWTLTVTAGTGVASVTGSGTILSGTSANISATPNAGFSFDRWEANPATWTPVPTTAAATITMPAQALTLTAYATEDTFLATITVQRDGTTWTTSGLAITLRYSGTTITLTDNLNGTFTYNVVPRTYNIYVGGVDTGRTLTVTSTGANSAVLDYWTLTVTAGTGVASVTGGGTILSGMTSNISATPTALFTFDRWEADPATWTPVPTTSAATITMPAHALTLTAFATEDPFLATITVERDGTTWSTSGLAISLRYSGTTINLTDNTDGTFTAMVLPRTYNIYVGGVDTGRTLVITSTGANSAILDYWTLTVSAGTGIASVTGSGTILSGMSASISATPTALYTFDRWEANPATWTPVPTTAAATITMPAHALTLTAYGTEDPFLATITVERDGSTWTTSGLTISLRYSGTTATLTDNGDGTFTAMVLPRTYNIYVGGVDTGRTLVITSTGANSAVLDYWTLTVTAGTGVASVTGSGTILSGKTANISATPTTGFTFDRWEANPAKWTPVPLTETATITMPAYALTLTAYATEDPYLATITVERDGATWTTSGLTISLFYSGTTINLTNNGDGTFTAMVLPRTYNIYVGGVDTGRTITINGSGTNSAILDYWTLTVTAGTGVASVTGSGTILSGMSASISATPTAGFTFDEWIANPATWTPVPTTATASITMPAHALTLTAYATEDPYLVTITVEWDGATWTTSGFTISLRYSGTTINLTDNADGTFTAMVLPRTYNIYVDGVDTGRTILVNGSGTNSTVLDYWTLTVTAGTGIASVTGSGTILSGMSANISATPAVVPVVYNFDRWEANPATWTPVPTTDTATITMPSFALTLTAYGTENAFLATVLVELDGVAWTTSGLTIALFSSGTTIPLTDNLDGTFTETVAPGTYSILVNGVDRGETIVISSTSTNSAIIDFLTMTVSGRVSLLSDSSALSGVTITYNIDGGADQTVTTNASGIYTITAITLLQSVTITNVSLTNYTLVNAATVLPAGPFTADSLNVNFQMTRNTFTVTGSVFLQGSAVGIGGVVIVYNEGAGDLSVTTAANGSFTITAFVGNNVTITNVSKANYTLVDPMIVLPSGPYAANTSGIIFEMTSDIPPVFEHFIRASSDAGSTISPSGVIVVQRGSSQTFVFSALEGYKITEVRIDGSILLTQAEIDLGQYTFTDIRANHTIQVRSTAGPGDVTLRIEIVEGMGYAEYRINNGSFVRYTAEVTFPAGSNITVRAVADSGYEFDRWETPNVNKSQQISFTNVRESLDLKLFFKESTPAAGDIPWLALGIVALVIVAAMFLIFLLWIRPGLHIVTQIAGENIHGVVVTYTINGGGKTSNGTKVSNSKGKLFIGAKKGHVVTVETAFKDGKSAINTPAVIEMENRRHFLDLIFE